MKTLIMQTNNSCNLIKTVPHLGMPVGMSNWERNNLHANRSIACVLIEAPDGYEIVIKGDGDSGYIRSDYDDVMFYNTDKKAWEKAKMWVKGIICARPIKRDTIAGDFTEAEQKLANFITKTTADLDRIKEFIFGDNND